MQTEILARLSNLEQQNQQVLMLLAKLAGIQAPQILAGLPKDEVQLIALARVDRSAAIAESKRRCRESSKKNRQNKQLEAQA